MLVVLLTEVLASVVCDKIAIHGARYAIPEAFREANRISANEFFVIPIFIDHGALP